MPLQANRLLRFFSLALAACLLALGTVQAQTPQLEARMLTPRVGYFQGQSGPASLANRGFMSNAGFVITDAGVVAFDALGTPALGQAMLDAIARVTPKKVVRVIVSHYHADHVYGLQSFRQAGAEIWAHVGGQAYLASDLAQSRLAQRRAELHPWVNASTRLEAADRWLKFEAGGELDVSLGGVRMRLIDASGAHSDEDLVLLIEDEGVLFAGDLYFTGRLPFVGNADSARWLGVLDALERRRPAIAVPGHGQASRNVAADLGLTRDYLRFLRQRMGAAVEAMQPFDEAYAQTDWSAYARQPAFEATNRVNAYGTYLRMEQESLKAK